MNTNIDFDLLLYGVMLVVLSVVAHRSAPDPGHSVLITGIVGGVAAVVWGVLGLRGFRRRIWPISTLVIVVLLLLIQAVRGWLEVKAGNDAFQPVALILTLLMVFGIGQVVKFVRGNNR